MATPAAAAATRLPLIDALRALVASMIAWHHFAWYEPLWSWAFPQVEHWSDWIMDYRWVVHVFFVISGFVTARSLSRRVWTCGRLGRFVISRYCRLGLPYLAAIAMAIAAAAFARGWLTESEIGPPPTLAEILAHVVFLQDILGYHSLSAGLWFVCIDFQLGLIFVAMLWLRDALAGSRGREPGENAGDVVMLMGWALAAGSLFYFNLDERWDNWAVYNFAPFFMGIVVQQALRRPERQILFWLYLVMVAAAQIIEWRSRVTTSIVVGLLLFVAGKTGLMERWPSSRVIRYLGERSYSLFLVHFPVFVVISTIWVRLDWTTRADAMLGLLTCYIASLVIADRFYRVIEAPSTRLSHKAA